MGLTRKLLSVSTMGAVDFKSDKERIANSTRKGMKAQKEMLAEIRKANAAQAIAPTHLNRWGVIGDRQANGVLRGAEATAAQAATPTPTAAPIVSPDNHFCWDGRAWQPMPQRPTEAPRSAPAGWYPDSSSPGNHRYWDGTRWTNQLRPSMAQSAVPLGWGSASASAALSFLPPAPRQQGSWLLRHKILTGVGAFLLLGTIASATQDGGGSAGTTNVGASKPNPVSSARATVAVPTPLPAASDCLRLFGGLGGEVVQAADADTGCLDQADVRLYPSLRECTDGRRYLSLHEPSLKRIYFGFVGEEWKSIKATGQNLALLDASRRECSGS